MYLSGLAGIVQFTTGQIVNRLQIVSFFLSFFHLISSLGFVDLFKFFRYSHFLLHLHSHFYLSAPLRRALTL